MASNQEGPKILGKRPREESAPAENKDPQLKDVLAFALSTVPADYIPTAGSDGSQLQSFILKLVKENHALAEQVTEYKKRSSELVVRLTQKEKDVSNLEAYIKDLTESTDRRAMQMRTTHMDPLVNENFQFLLAQIEVLEKRLKIADEDKKARNFTPHTIAGIKLVDKCRKLQKENEEFGKELAQGKVHKLELALEEKRTVSEELEKGFQESSEYVVQLDEEIEAMQERLLATQDKLQRTEAALAQALANQPQPAATSDPT